MRYTDFADYRRTYETVLVIVLALIFMVLATQRIMELRVAAERVMVAQSVSAFRTGLSQHLVELAMHGDVDALAALHGTNPVEFLREVPKHYHTLSAPLAPEAMQGYRWYFDPASGVLTYRVAHEDELITTLPPPARIRFQVSVHYEDRNNNGRFDSRPDVLKQVDLLPLEPYAWRGVE